MVSLMGSSRVLNPGAPGAPDDEPGGAEESVPCSTTSSSPLLPSPAPPASPATPVGYRSRLADGPDIVQTKRESLSLFSGGGRVGSKL